MSDNQHYVILVEEKGKRLWLCGHEATSEQFVDFLGAEHTLLRQTHDRVLKVVSPDNIFVSINQSYPSDIHQQLPGILEDRILAEPIRRNTTPSMTWAVRCITRFNLGANLLVTPSDQIIQNGDASVSDIREGFAFINQRDELLTLGTEPTRLELGYGYIQLGEPTGNGVCQAQSFTERPERDFTKMSVESSELYRNTGIFMVNTRYLSHCLLKLPSSVSRDLGTMTPNWTVEEENHFINKNSPLYPNLSVDNGVLEKSDRVYVMRYNFGWADIGTRHSIYKAMQESESDNVVIDSDAILEDCQNNVIKLPKNKLAIFSGLEGYIIAEYGDVLFICKKGDSSALVRKYVSEVQIKKGTDYT